MFGANLSKIPQLSHKLMKDHPDCIIVFLNCKGSMHIIIEMNIYLEGSEGKKEIFCTPDWNANDLRA